MPVDSTILPHKVQTTPKSSTSSEPVLTISIPNNCQIIEVAGEIQAANNNFELTFKFVQDKNLCICSTLSNDAQAEDNDISLPNNLKCMEEVFSKEHASLLPPHHNGIDMTIDILLNTLPRVVPMFRLWDKKIRS
ncbi:hypothetical protein EV44_g3539 [Erysiphe necator]|uniref:Uncharacterized protein n=1 Tax=Uncinula necator TaxID=52586 RepID=A0A0B1P6V7_UNCNE|nr:hypothetical protein EV44_g3539 [Erysiphe necator]